MLPLFDEPAPSTPAVERIAVDSPEAFAFHTGLRQGRGGQAESFRYDHDERKLFCGACGKARHMAPPDTGELLDLDAHPK